MKVKYFPWILAVVMFTLLVSACSSSEPDTPDGESANVEEQASMQEDTSAVSTPVTLSEEVESEEAPEVETLTVLDQPMVEEERDEISTDLPSRAQTSYKVGSAKVNLAVASLVSPITAFTQDWEVDPEPHRIAIGDAATLADSPNDLYPEYTQDLGPGETFVGYFGHASVVDVTDTRVMTIPWTGGENMLVVGNASTEDLQFVLTGFPQTGFGRMIFSEGYMLNVEFLARYPVQRPNHCGYLGAAQIGCPDVTVYAAVWDGRTFDVSDPVIYDEPLVVEDVVPDVLDTSWAQLQPHEAWMNEMDRTKTIRHLELTSSLTTLDLGITFYSPWALVSASGLTLSTRSGDEIISISPSADAVDVVLLTNDNGDTTVMRLSGFDELYAYEFNVGVEMPNGELLARGQLGPDGPICECTTARLWTVTWASDGVMQVYQVSEEPVVYTDILPPGGSQSP